jgi:hypothetical protein
MGNRSGYQRQDIYDMFLAGKSIEQIVESTSIRHGYVKTLYTDFIVASAHQKANDSYDRIMQVRAIERKLWSMYEIKKKTDYDWAQIRELEHTYVHFNATN